MTLPIFKISTQIIFQMYKKSLCTYKSKTSLFCDSQYHCWKSEGDRVGGIYGEMLGETSQKC